MHAYIYVSLQVINAYMNILNSEEEKRIQKVRIHYLLSWRCSFNFCMHIIFIQLPITKRPCTRVLCASTLLYEALMRWKAGHEEYSLKKCMKYIKVYKRELLPT